MTFPDARARAERAGFPMLTQVPGKLDWYDFDPYFRDACDDVSALVAAGRNPDLWRHAFIIFRPDAVVTRSIETGLRLLEAAQFDVVDVIEFAYSHLTTREGWRYQLNVASRDRIDAMDLIMTATPSLFCLVRDRGSDDTVPASTRLSAMKGPSLPEARQPGQFRAEMGPVQASVLTFVHTPDEPADLLRELAVFLPPNQRRRAFEMFAGKPKAWSADRILNRVRELYAQTPSHSLSAVAVLAAIRDKASAENKSILDQIAARSGGTMHEVVEALRGLDAGFSRFAEIAICAYIGERHIGGADPVIPDVDLTAWLLPSREARRTQA